jgi:hypothetical protein
MRVVQVIEAAESHGRFDDYAAVALANTRSF